MHPPPPLSTLFPYTTLFRSARARPLGRTRRAHGRALRRHGVARRGAEESLARARLRRRARTLPPERRSAGRRPARLRRSEEHTSELQSRQYLVCRLLLEKKK